MMDDPTTPQHPFEDQREGRILRSVQSLFRHCEKSKDPILAYERAQWKVSYLAGDGVRGALCHIESALCERRHALLAVELGRTDQATEHHRLCGLDLQAFQRTIRRELSQSERPLSTPELTERIRRNLEVGQWRRATLDLDAALERTDLDGSLPRLDTYLSARRLEPERFAPLQAKLDHYNSAVERQARQRAHRASSAELAAPAESAELKFRIREAAECEKERERKAQILHSVASLFRHCEKSKDSLRAYDRASSKVESMFREGGRPELSELSAALRERRQFLIMAGAGRRQDAEEHNHMCRRHLRGFQEVVRHTLRDLREPVPTPVLTERIHRHLQKGEWSLALEGIHAATDRVDLERPLRLEAYPRAKDLEPHDRAYLEVRLDRYNAGADRHAQRLTQSAPAAQLSTPHLRVRIHEQLTAGRWNDARVAINELAHRPDIGKPLPDLDEYPRQIPPRQRAILDACVARCEASARLQRGEFLLARLPASAVRAHVTGALHSGDWALARHALHELARRPSIGLPLPRLQRYPLAGQRLLPQQYNALNDRIAQCNVRAAAQNLSREVDFGTRHPDVQRARSYAQQLQYEASGVKAMRAGLSKSRGGLAR